MKMNDFLCSCLGMDGEVIDRITDDFGIDIDEFDVFDCLREKSTEELKDVGRELLCKIFDKIVADFSELDEDKFDYDFSSPSYPDMYYDSKRFDTKEELDAIVEELEDAD